MSKLSANELTSRANTQSKIYGVKNKDLKKNPVAIFRELGVFPSDYNDVNDNNRISNRSKTAIKIARENLNRKYLYDTEQVSSTITIVYNVKYKKDKGKNMNHIREKNKTVIGNRYNLYNRLDDEIHMMMNYIEEGDSPVDSSEVVETIVSNPILVRQGGNLIYRKMKECRAYDLGVDYITKNNKWNKHEGTCVFDFIYYKYFGKRGMKKLLPNDREKAYQNLKEIFGENSIDDGVNIKQIELLCKKYDISMFAMDKQENCIVYNKSDTQNLPILIFVISNNHFYPIENSNRIKSLVEKHKDKSNNTSYKISNDEPKKVREFTEVIYPVGNEPRGNEYASYIFSKLKTLPMGYKNLRVVDGNITGFVIDNVLYLTEEVDKDFYDFIVDMNSKYSGESPFSILGNLTSKYFEKIESKLSPMVYETLFTRGIKDRTHYGTTRDLQCYMTYIKTHFGTIEKAVEEGHIVITDINKCYSNCIYNPLDDFIIYGIDDVWENYDGILKTGLYYVNTNDLALMTQSNIYSNKIIEKAIEEGISLTIKKQLIHKPTHIGEEVIKKEYFRGLFDDIKELCGNNVNVIKLLNNLIIGMLGKTETKNYKASVDTNVDDVWEYFMDYNKKGCLNLDESLLIKQISGNIHLYGFIKKIRKLEITLPIWIQILDWSNIALYDMGKAVGGEIIFRHTDLIVSIGGKIPEDKISKKWGDYKVEGNINEKKLLSMMRMDRGIAIHKFHNQKWKDNNEFNSSNQFEDIIQYATENGGLLITGRAGTGKSYIVLEGLKNREDVLYMSFTNKAARNIQGNTIHRTLMLNKTHKLTKDSSTNFKFKKYCVVDEIGMTPSYLLKYLHSIKKNHPNIIFICMGDVRQLKPVEEGRIVAYKVFSSPYVKDLCNYNRIELTERHRYDEKLGEYLDIGYDTEYWNGLRYEEQSVENLVLSRNICYFNNTRHRINKLCNLYLSRCQSGVDGRFGGHSTLSNSKESYKIGDGKKEIILYDGLKVIAISSNKEYDFFNSEEFIVDCYNEVEVILSSVYNHNLLQLKFDEFLKYFDMNYIGTTHKSQGDTYSGMLCLFDFNKMLTDKSIIYTACSRATKFDNIVIAEYRYQDKKNCLDTI